MSLEQKYQLKSEHNHILDNPDTYIGSIEQVDSPMHILREDSNEIKEETISYIPALLKLFDEGIVNCRDHVVRMKQSTAENAKLVTNIEISIDNGTITMTNDGNGIDVERHPEHKMWIPELIFGHLRTSTNYDKDEKKLTGGKNGFGFKLVLIWSSFGSVETVDHIRGLKYYQEFTNNLTAKSEPVITKASKTKPYTKIVFRPDYQRLGIEGLSEDMIALFKKRVYDISAITDKKVKVKYNSSLVEIKDFTQYVNLYIGKETKRIYEECGDRWEYIASLSPTHEFVQVSFVNGIHTSKGGKHVEYILNQIVRKLIAYIEKKKKVTVNATSIKEQLILFIRCDIENPAFDSQSKDYMNTPSSKFGSVCTVSDKFVENLAKMGVMDSACSISELKLNKETAKKTNGKKVKTIIGIPKLMDANWAGTDKSRLCTIILCEGDSAKTGIVSGLSTEDRNTYGIYPLKGKVLNVRGENREKISKNNEITEIKKILGLEDRFEYTADNIGKHLRYGRVLVMTDSDVDGSHIKGLIINLFHVEWNSLLRIDGFLGFMNTPILKARKGVRELCFYNNGEYETWKSENPTNGWTIKYYKGLGTSTRTEFQQYFKTKKMVDFEYTDEATDDTIDMAFNKKRAEDRKAWIKNYDRECYLNTSNPRIKYEEFINKELIHFSHSDCDRSIPNMMDGLKVSQRKILYSAFKKNLSTEIKVAQFSGYVSEHSCYHNGEQSLNLSIISMAQNYVGSNNINLLVPVGQFGTREGNDSASPRYIFTYMNPITRLIFHPFDNKILNYLTDDGTLVEPMFYVPIIPMILVNGSNGIGTGYSTDIMCYNPRDIVAYLRDKLRGADVAERDFIPYYEGFAGTITRITPERFLIRGKYEILGEDQIRITEIPFDITKEAYKKYLDLLATSADKKTPPLIKDMGDMSTDISIDYRILLQAGKLQELISQTVSLHDETLTELEKVFKLYTTNTTTNMHMFNAEDKLVKYAKVSDIIDDYYEVRYRYYVERKRHQLEEYRQTLVVMSNKRNFIRENLAGTIDLRRKKREEVYSLLMQKDYTKIEDSYNYLIKLPVDIVTEENVEKIQNDYDALVAEIERVEGMSIEVMWLTDMHAFEEEYVKYLDERRQVDSVDVTQKVTDKKKKPKTSSGK